MISLLLFLLACTDGKPDGTDPTGTRSTITPVPVDADQDGAALPEDCDDADPTRYPGATEACNGVDDDCDGAVDEDLPLTAWYPDADGDGWGVPEGAVEACAAPPAYVANAEDCDDGAADVHPDALDLPGDGLDADCDGDFTCEVLVTYAGDWRLSGDDAEAQASALCDDTYNAVDGKLLVYDVPMTNLDGLGCLCSIGEYAYIHENPLLESLSGLERLSQVGEVVWVEDNPALTSLEGLSGVQSVGGILAINSPALTSLTGMDRLKYTEGVYVDNAGITSLAGLEGLEQPVEWLYLFGYDTTALTTLEGMPEFEEIADIYLLADSIADLAALRRLSSTGRLYLKWLNLTSLGDLAALVEVDGEFILWVDIPDLTGLENLRRVETFDLVTNSLTGLDNLESVDTLGLHGNMTSFEPLHLTIIPGGLEVSYCDSLTSFAGLDLLESVGGSVELGRLEPIDNVDALAALRTIGGYLAIYDTTLTSLAGLHGLESVGGDVYVGYNPYLPDSEVDALVEAIGRENIGGEVIVEENGGEL